MLATAGMGLVAWGSLYARVQRNERDLDAKASKDVVAANQEAIVMRLARIEKLLDKDAA